jgi:LacI family transcriptional regulator
MRRIGVAEIAKFANVSKGTVDRAMHNRGRISDETRSRVLASAERLGYRPNLAARALSAGPGSIPIGVCIPREIESYFDQIREGIFDEARRFEDLGLSVFCNPIERLSSGEVGAFAKMMESGYRGIIITPGNPALLTPLIDEAEDRGIRVVCVDSDAPLSRRSAAACVDAEVSGRLAAELLGRFVVPNSEVAIVTGMLLTEDHRKRVKGFSELFNQICPGGQLAEIIEAHDDEDEAFQKCHKMLQERPSIAGLYISTANCLPVCRAVSGLGLSHHVRVVASDLFPEMIPYFEKGIIAASIYARPFAEGRLAVRVLVDHILNRRQSDRDHYLAPQVVTRSTLHLFREIRKGKIEVFPKQAEQASVAF